MTRVIQFTRYFYDGDTFQTSEQVWKIGPDSYRLEGHASNPKSGPYGYGMTPEELQQWKTEHPEGVTTPYDPVTHLPQ